ncbi:MAG: SH3 domain-containing protein [Phycisphaerales bacterium]|nr:SH3 domain-containing protein [Phycisphaerales bacterium]
MDRARIAGPLVAFAFFAAVAAPTNYVGAVHTQQGAPPPSETVATPAQSGENKVSPYFAAVTADNVYVRSGPSVQSSYPFGKMNRGNVVRVVEENFGWARVETAGIAFAQLTGFVPADERVQLSADGASITATATTELRAPNIGAESTPESSWKQIGRIDAGATLTVVTRLDTERGSIWTVRLPEFGEGWINSNFLRRATPAEASTFDTIASATEVETALVIATIEGGAASGNPAEPGAASDVAIITETAIAVPVPTKSPEQIAAESRRATFADLEATWLKVKGQPLADAELGALYARYVALGVDAANDPSMKGRIAARVAQLEVQQEVQNKIFDLQATRARLNGECDQINGVAIAIEARSEYTAVGVLNASIVYDGTQLPLLFRLVDPSTGQTVSYVVPGDGFQLSTMLGTLIGIKGEKAYDDSLKLDTITPKTIDFLTSRKDA